MKITKGRRSHYHDAGQVQWQPRMFIAGLTVIMGLIIGGGICLSFLSQISGLGPHISAGYHYASVWVITLAVVIPNVLITRGWRRATEINRAHAWLQLFITTVSIVVGPPMPSLLLGIALAIPILTLWAFHTAAYRQFALNYYLVHRAGKNAKNKRIEQ